MFVAKVVTFRTSCLPSRPEKGLTNWPANDFKNGPEKVFTNWPEKGLTRLVKKGFDKVVVRFVLRLGVPIREKLRLAGIDMF